MKPFPRSPSLAAWLILMVMSSVLLALAGTTVLIDRFARKHAEERAHQHLDQVADKFRDALDHGMARQVAAVQLLAELPALLRADDPARARAALDAMRRREPEIAWIGLAAADGKVLAANDGLLEGADVSKRPWFQGGKSTLFLGDVHAAVLLAKLLPQAPEPWRFVDISLPVAANPGSVLGVHLSWTWAAALKRDLLDPTLRNDGAQAFVLDRQGAVLLGPPDVKAPDGAAADQFTAVSPSRGHGGFSGLGWQVVVQQPREVAMADYLLLRRQLMGVAGAVLLLFVPLAWALARKLARPLTVLADSIGQNQHLGDRPLPRLAGFAEAEVLSTALNELVERQREHNNTLQELNASLDQRVRDRTAALNLALQGEALNLQRMQNIANSVPAQIAHFDADGHCLFANQAALRLAGLPPERSGMLRLVDLLGDPVPPALLPMASSATTLPQTLRFQHARVVGDDTWHSEVHWLPDGEHGVGAAGGRPGHYLVSFDVSQLKEVELRLQQLSRADALTGLPNRRQFDEHMRASLARERRTGRGLGVVYLDLDHFKRINDTLGHAGGDEVLKTFAQRVGSVIRATDLLARVGGDEFVLVCEGVANPEQMQVLADKVLTAVRAPLRLQNQQVLLSTSMGSALMQDGESVDHLLARADAALYRAKQAGRNGHQFAAADEPVTPTAPPVAQWAATQVMTLAA